MTLKRQILEVGRKLKNCDIINSKKASKEIISLCVKELNIKTSSVVCKNLVEHKNQIDRITDARIKIEKVFRSAIIHLATEGVYAVIEAKDIIAYVNWQDLDGRLKPYLGISDAGKIHTCPDFIIKDGLEISFFIDLEKAISHCEKVDEKIEMFFKDNPPTLNVNFSL